MRKAVLHGCIVAAVATLAAANPAQPANPDQNQAVARLEALLKEQQRQIELLEQQVAAAQAASADAARVEVMRQQIREILDEQEFREKLMPSMLQAGYERGFFIRSSDDKFLMRVNGGAQFRWTHYATRSDNRYTLPLLERDDRTGFDLQRLRLSISGHAYTKDLTYNIAVQADSPSRYDVVALEAWANYRFADELQFRAGIMRLPSTRANQTIYDLNQQLVDRPVVDAIYGLGYGVGAKFWGQLFDKKLEYHLMVANGMAEGESYSAGRTITVDPAEIDGNPAIAFRTVWHVLGEDPERDWELQSDLPKHESPALDIGFHYAFNDDYGDRQTTRIPFPRRSLLPGGFGLTNTNGLQINQFGLDAAFKWQGFSATGEYIVRIVDPRRAGRLPYAPWWLLTGDDSTVAQHGAYVQLGYFLPIPGLEDKLEAVARVGGISTLAGEQEGTWEYAGGVNYYFNQNVKLQADVTKVSEVPISNPYSSLATVNDDALIFRVQFQVAF